MAMNPPNKKLSLLSKPVTQRNRCAGHTSQFKPLIAGSKIAAAQGKRETAESICHAQQKPKVIQTKRSWSPFSQADQARRQPVAPPVYRPQLIPKVCQTKK